MNLLKELTKLKPYIDKNSKGQLVTLEEWQTIGNIYNDIIREYPLIGAPYKPGCPTCKIDVMKSITNNYRIESEKAIVKETVNFKGVPQKATKIKYVRSEQDPNELSLKELRELYPDIKSNSVKGFLKKLNESK